MIIDALEEAIDLLLIGPDTIFSSISYLDEVTKLELALMLVGSLAFFLASVS